MNTMNQEQEHPDRKNPHLEVSSASLEEQIHDLLTIGEMETEEQDAAVRRRVIPPTEIRIQTTMDPIVEETKRFRSIAKEVDNRYDHYLERAQAIERNTSSQSKDVPEDMK